MNSHQPTSPIFDYAILDGDLLPVTDAKISIFNAALFYSFGVYETVKVDRGRPFYLEEHLHRLANSARMIELDLQTNVEELSRWFEMLIEVDRQATWSLRIIALGPTEREPAAIIGMQPTPLPAYAPDLYRQGAAVILHEGERLLPACKSLNTLVNYLARRRAEQSGALEGILHHNGQLSEGSRTNIFAVRQGQLITPPQAMVLSGITREVIIQAMQESDTPVVEAALPIDLSLYEEFFISSTSMHVMPVTRIDGQPVNQGRVGPITKTAMARFEAHYRQYMESAQC